MADSKDWLELLGKHPEDPTVAKFIEQAGECDISEVAGTWYYSFYEPGFCLQFEDGALKAIQYFCKAREGFSPFSGPLPHGLQPGFTRAEVRAALGDPPASRAGWDRYQFADHSLHAEYADKTENISLVTLMTTAPGA